MRCCAHDRSTRAMSQLELVRAAICVALTMEKEPGAGCRVPGAGDGAAAPGRMKSKTPCLPGFLPVMKEVHAGGVMGGGMERNAPDTPTFINFARFGMLP